MQLHWHNLCGFSAYKKVLKVFYVIILCYLASINVIWDCYIYITASKLVEGYFLFQASFNIGLDFYDSYKTDECFKSLISNCLTLPSAPTEAKISLSLEKWIS
jgi:hypothetical protein